MLLTWFLCTLLAGVALTLLVEKLARRYGVMSKSSFRRRVSEGTPLLGGLAVIVASVPGVLYYAPEVGPKLFLAYTPLLIFGFCDDIWEMSGRWKFLAQIVSSCLWLALIPKEHNLYFQMLPVAVFALPIAASWLIGMTNAFNLIDGVDGQASLLGITNWAALALVMPNSQFTWIFIAAQFGFLFRNAHPAKIYLGEIGSSFLGFSLGAFATLVPAEPANFSQFVAVVFLFAVPLYDTVSAISRRVRSGRSLYHGDRDHLHHRMIKLQFSPWQTTITMSILNLAGSAAFVMAAMLTETKVKSGLFATISILMFMVFYGVQFCERHFSQRVMGLGRGILMKYLQPKQLSAPNAAATRSVVIDLLPCFRELQMQGILTLHSFLKDFAYALQDVNPNGTVQFIGSYSVALVLYDKVEWKELEMLRVGQKFHDLFANYHCLTSPKVVPDTVRFCDAKVTSTLVAQIESMSDEVAALKAA